MSKNAIRNRRFSGFFAVCVADICLSGRDIYLLSLSSPKWGAARFAPNHPKFAGEKKNDHNMQPGIKPEAVHGRNKNSGTRRSIQPHPGESLTINQSWAGLLTCPHPSRRLPARSAPHSDVLPKSSGLQQRGLCRNVRACRGAQSPASRFTFSANAGRGTQVERIIGFACTPGKPQAKQVLLSSFLSTY